MRTVQEESWSYRKSQSDNDNFEYYKPPIYKGLAQMDNLTFMARYEKFRQTGILSEPTTQQGLAAIVNGGKLPISEMTNEQLLELQVEIPQLIENLRIALQVADHTKRQRGEKVALRIKSEDLKYIPSPAFIDESAEKRLSKKGESEEKIREYKEKVNKAADIDFSDI